MAGLNISLRLVKTRRDHDVLNTFCTRPNRSYRCTCTTGRDEIDPNSAQFRGLEGYNSRIGRGDLEDYKGYF